jgi:hypothetical protein
MYALIHNNQIQVGPRDWNYMFFKDYLDEEGLDATALTKRAPEDNKIITADWKIIPVTSIQYPALDEPFEQPAGPYWTIHDEYITGEFLAVPNTVEMVKGKLKEVVTNNRYKVEVGGCPFTFADGTEVTLYTTREDRNVYLQAYQILTDGGSIVFKFPNAVFKSVSKVELGLIVETGSAHIQGAFIWEADKYDEIDLCETIADLKLIDVKHPSQVTEDNNARPTN